MSSPRLLRQVEALQVMETMDQEILRRVVRLFYLRVVKRFERRTRLPTTDFDLLYFIEGILRSAAWSGRLKQSSREQMLGGFRRTTSVT